MKILAIIPARSGSKRLKNKNRLNFGGKPLINWTIDFVSKIKNLNNTVISTDDKSIIGKNQSCKKIIFFKRQKKFCGDKVKTITIVFDVIKRYEKLFGKIDTILLLQPTSPFRSKKNLEIGLKKYKKYKTKNSIVSVSKTKNSLKKNYIIKNSFLLRANSKLNEIKFQINGNFYLASKNFLKKHKSFIVNNKTIPVVLSGSRFNVDIDTKKDFNIAKSFI